jgi:hypothetical protein
MLDADHDNSLQCAHLPADLRWCNAALTRKAARRECRLEVKPGRRSVAQLLHGALRFFVNLVGDPRLTC